MSSSSLKNTSNFMWKIIGFNYLKHVRGDPIRSPIFTAESLRESFWYLEFYPKGTLHSDVGYASCFLIRSEADTGPPVVSYPFSIQILSSNGDVIYSRIDTDDQCLEILRGIPVGWKNYLKFDLNRDKSKFFPDDTLWIRCQLQVDTLEEVTDFWVENNIGVDRIVFDCTIGNFKNSNSRHMKFECSVASKYVMCYKVYGENITIFIQKLDRNSLQKKAICKLSFLDIKGYEFFSKTDEYIFKSVNEIWTFPFLIKTTDLVEGKYSNNGAITILFDFSISNETETEECEVHLNKSCVLKKFPIADQSSLLKDIESLYWKTKICDISLHAEDGITIPAHRSILAARSPVLCNIFKNATVNRLDFKQFEPRILRMFLKFLYSGFVNDSDYDGSYKLLKMGDANQINSLVLKCASILKKLKSDKNLPNRLFHRYV